MTLNYTFTEQSGPSYYSEYTDEDFYDTEDFEWDYELDTDQIAKAFIDMFGDKDNTLEQNCIAVAEEVMEEDDKKELLAAYEANTLEEAIEAIKLHIIKYNERMAQQGPKYKQKKIDAANILDQMMDINYYADNYEDELTDYFYEDAHEDFIENYNN